VKKLAKEDVIYTPVGYSFLGQDGIKPPGTKIKYTEAMLREYMKCAEDPVYFIENYYFIVDLDKGLTNITLIDYQVDLVQHMHDNRFSVVLASRQVGKTIITVGYLLWYLLFNSYKEIAVLSKTGPDASDIMRKLKRAFVQVPEWLQQNVTEWNMGSVSLENGNKIYARCTTEDAGRSASANILFLDEFAFVPQNIANQFYKSAYPIISNSKESKVIICSTPNGYNHFYTIYQRAVRGDNFYKPFVIYWWQFPGRDEEWKKQTIANLATEEGMSNSDGEAKFAQEYDLNFDNTSVRALLSSESQRRISDRLISVTEIENHPLSKIGVRIYEDYQEGYVYFACVDTGGGAGADYHALNIIKVEPGKFKQVAVFYDNEISTVEYAEVVDAVSKHYGKAYQLVENNGVGLSVVDHLWYTLESPSMIILDKKNLGVRMTKMLRNKGIAKIKDYIETGVLEINDVDTLRELSFFTQNAKSKKFQAEAGNNDDLVMSLVMFGYFSNDMSFDSFLEDKSKGGLDAIRKNMREKISEDNPFAIDHSAILDEKEAAKLVAAMNLANLISPIYR